MAPPASNASNKADPSTLAEALLQRARGLNEIASVNRAHSYSTMLANRVALQPWEAREAVRRLLFHAKHRNSKTAIFNLMAN